MKKMQDFRTWLSDVNEESTPYLRRLAALTRVDRAQLVNVSNGEAWFIWEAAQSASVS